MFGRGVGTVVALLYGVLRIAISAKVRSPQNSTGTVIYTVTVFTYIFYNPSGVIRAEFL